MASYTEGTTPKDQLMGFLVRKFSLNSDDQLTVRGLLKKIEDGSIQNYVDRIKSEQIEKSVKKHQEQVSNAQQLSEEQRLDWLQSAKDATEFLIKQRNS